jgi:surface protein
MSNETTKCTDYNIKEIIKDYITYVGPNVDLNHLDVSKVTNMHMLFSKFGPVMEGREFHGNISDWDVSNVTRMNSMFYQSEFNGDISKWNVSKVRDMSGMFRESKFARDISKWNINNVLDDEHMFKDCPISDKNMPKKSSSLVIFIFIAVILALYVML